MKKPLIFLDTLVLFSLLLFVAISNTERAVAQVCTPEGYVTTGAENQVKSGALGIVGLFKAFNGMSVNNKRVSEVAMPIAATDAATKAYVDQAITSAIGGNGSGSSACGVTGGYVESEISDGRSRSCSTWGMGATGTAACTALSGYSCGGVSSSDGSSGTLRFGLCVRNSCLGRGVTGGYVESEISDGRSRSCSTWGMGATGTAACTALSGYSCGGVSSSDGSSGTLRFGLCVRNN